MSYSKYVLTGALLAGLCGIAQAEPHDSLTPPPAREIVTVRGSYYEMGVQHGLAFRDEILFNVSRMYQFEPGLAGNQATYHAALQDKYDAVAAYAPEVFEEIEGIAAGAAVDPCDIKLMTFRAWNLDLCTAAGMKDSSGNVFIGGNIDDPPECYVLVRHEPLDGYSYVDMRWAGAAWGCNGTNETGFGYTLAGLWGTEDWNDPQPATNIPTGIAHRKLLENCTTVDEAIDVLAEARVRWNAILGDAQGNLAMAQCMGSVMGVEHADDPCNNGMVFSSNHIFTREGVNAMATQGLSPGIATGSDDRYDVLEAARNDPNYDRTIEDVKSLLRNHENYVPGNPPYFPSICNDRQAFSSLVETTAGEPEYQQAMAPCCQDTYTGYEVETDATLLEVPGFESNDWTGWTQYIGTESGTEDPVFQAPWHWVEDGSQGIWHNSPHKPNPAPTVEGTYAGCIASCGSNKRMGAAYHVFTTDPNEEVEVNIAWWLNYNDGGGNAYLTITTLDVEPTSYTDGFFKGTEGSGGNVLTLTENTLGNYFDLVQDTFVSQGVVIVAVASDHFGGVTFDAINSPIDPGDTDLDGDVDNVDFGALYRAFTGPYSAEGTDNADRADLVYDPDTGNVKLVPLEAEGRVISSYSLTDSGGQFDTGELYLIPFLSSTDTATTSQIGQTELAMGGDGPGDLGYSGIWNLGDIFPTGMSLAELEGFLDSASYCGLSGSGNYDLDLLMTEPDDKTWAEGDFDKDGDVDNVDFGTLYGNYTGPLAGGMDLQVTPEPATIGLLCVGAVAMLKRRKL